MRELLFHLSKKLKEEGHALPEKLWSVPALILERRYLAFIQVSHQLSSQGQLSCLQV